MSIEKNYLIHLREGFSMMRWAILISLTPCMSGQKEEYSMHVRGRVIYDQEEKKFLVYADKRILRSEKRKKEIRKAFNIGPINVVFLEDEHYTTLRYWITLRRCKTN